MYERRINENIIGLIENIIGLIKKYFPKGTEVTGSINYPWPVVGSLETCSCYVRFRVRRPQGYCFRNPLGRWPELPRPVEARGLTA